MNAFLRSSPLLALQSQTRHSAAASVHSSTLSSGSSSSESTPTSPSTTSPSTGPLHGIRVSDVGRASSWAWDSSVLQATCNERKLISLTLTVWLACSLDTCACFNLLVAFPLIPRRCCIWAKSWRATLQAACSHILVQMWSRYVPSITSNQAASITCITCNQAASITCNQAASKLHLVLCNLVLCIHFMGSSQPCSRICAGGAARQGWRSAFAAGTWKWNEWE